MSVTCISEPITEAGLVCCTSTEPYVQCWSSVTVENSLLFCQVDEDLLTELKNATLW